MYNFLDYCFENGIDYAGRNIRNIPNVESSKQCQLECKKNSDCSYFTYDIQTKNCFLRNGRPAIVAKSVAISGPKLCSAKGEIKLSMTL